MKRRGFTLVEILIVLAIITLLVAILLPVLSSVRAAGRSAVCVSNLRQLGQAMQQYTADNDHFPRGLDPADRYTPQMWAGNPDAGGDILTATPLLSEVMAPYIKSPQLWKCPSDTGFDVVDITGLPLDARPSCYEKFGMSYFYRTELTLLNLAEERLPRPAETNVLSDAAGAWHGAAITNGWNGKRYNMLFADGHVKNVDSDTSDRAWSTPVR